MEYLNQFHKEAVERKMQTIKDSKKLPMDPEKEARRHFEMHARIKRNYPESEK